VCRNCGLPIASATDPVRGVVPGRVDMPSAHRSGLSATVGLALVVGLLLVAGTLAVSGGGILSTGGRLGVDAAESLPAVPAGSGSPIDDATVTVPGNDDAGELTGPPEAQIGTKLGYTCEAGAIKDLGRGKWFMSLFRAGSRIDDGYDQVAFELTREGSGKAKQATTVRLAWMDPAEARDKYGAPSKVQGSRALVLTFDGPVGISVNQAVDSLQLERESVDQAKNIQMFQGSDDKVHAIVGLKSESCARLEGKGWGKKSKGKDSKVLLQIERME
jgi:hypothetical protein